MAEEDVPLSAAQRSRIRRLSQPHVPDAGEEAGELNVVPYLDIITNIMMFVLASVSVSFIASIDTTPPSIGGKGVRGEMASKALNLSAFVTNEGISLKTSSGNIAPGCDGIGAGLTAPRSCSPRSTSESCDEQPGTGTPVGEGAAQAAGERRPLQGGPAQGDPEERARAGDRLPQHH